jgi:hypothetical protein
MEVERQPNHQGENDDPSYFKHGQRRPGNHEQQQQRLQAELQHGGASPAAVISCRVRETHHPRQIVVRFTHPIPETLSSVKGWFTCFRVL